jgi:TolB-like protein
VSSKVASERIEKRFTTIVAADIVGYSRLVALDEDGIINRFRNLRDNVVSPSITAAQGRVIKTMGDGILMEFPSPEKALRAAMNVQNDMQRHETHLPETERLRFRIGINFGEAIIDSEDVLGDVVNVAARLEGLAPPGGICLSQAARDRLPDGMDVAITSLGLQYVRNMPVPVSVWNVHIDGVHAEVDTPVQHSERPSVVVLAFENLSSDPDQEFLADGIASDVATQLARFRSLFVIARNSAFAYKGTHTDVRQIAHELGVSYVVEGSVRRSGARLRLTVTLIRAKSGEALWSKTWNREIVDVFDVQDELTKAIVNEIAPEMGANERAISLKKPTGSLTAWELCQRGLAEFFAYTSDSYPRAFELFQASARADPNFALPRALLARWYSAVVATGRSQDPMADLTKGIEHANAAIATDDRLEDAYVALGSILGIMCQTNEATEVLDRAYALNDNNPSLFHARCYVCLHKSEIDVDGLEAASRQAIALTPRDPAAWGFHYMLALAHWARDVKKGYLLAQEPLETACKFAHADYLPWLSNAVMNVRMGNVDAAKRHLDRALAKNPGLTMERYRAGLRFPGWPALFETIEPELNVLVDLGLPRR